jgi:hypothetical protein
MQGMTDLPLIFYAVAFLSVTREAEGFYKPKGKS